jgi:hypothetical protein
MSMDELGRRIKAVRATAPKPAPPVPIKPEWLQALREGLPHGADPERPLLDQMEELAETDDRVSELLTKAVYPDSELMSVLRPFPMDEGTTLSGD